MAKNILKEICDRRLADIARKGFGYGREIPRERCRPIAPFLEKPGTILEIKRASPSKGDIAPGLDSAATAQSYIGAGTAAISVLTEENYFKGSLDDLKAVARLAHENGDKVAVLRKDFLLEPEEIEIAYKCGADAVLLIARILETPKLLQMAEKAFALGLSVLLELRDEEAVAKAFEVLRLAKKMRAEKQIVLGVNARDLKTFTIDMLIPLKIKCQIEAKFVALAAGERTQSIRVISESGVLTREAAALTGGLGFDGILIGEAVAKDPANAQEFVRAFVENAEAAKAGAGAKPAAAFWGKIAEKINRIEQSGNYRPLVKICGITNCADATAACECGADVLGFICEEKFARHADLSAVGRIRREVEGACKARKTPPPAFVGVVTQPDSAEAQRARELVAQGVFDAIQFHGCGCDINLGYQAVRFGEERQLGDLKASYAAGAVRMLLDAHVPGVEGGTGAQIPDGLVKKAGECGKLWLAGGINPENVAEILAKHRPELIDVSSGVEAAPGKKDHEKLRKLFAAI